MNIVARLAFAALILASPGIADAQTPGGVAMSQASRMRAVMSSADFEAAMEGAGFDESQRTIAAAAFDDAQLRMFDAKRTADEQAARDRVGAARALRASVLAGVDELFASLGAIARPDQRRALDREHRNARLRTVRATIDGRRAGRGTMMDAELVLAAGGFDAETAAKARAAMEPAMDRLEATLVRVAESREALERSAGPDRRRPEVPEAERRERQEAAAALRQLHQAAIESAVAAMPPRLGREFGAAAARRIWPGTSDASAPLRALGQLLSREIPPERQAAIEAAAAAWWAAWWPATMKVAEATDGNARGHRDPALIAPRTAADRDAWRSLAALDEKNRDFHLAMAEGRQPPGRQPEMFAGARGGPSLPAASAGKGLSVEEAKKKVAEALGGGISPEDIEVGGVGGVAAGGDRKGGADAAKEPIDVGEYLSEASHLDDPVIDLLSFDADEPEMSLAGTRVPDAMEGDEARAIAGMLGVQADDPEVASLLADYRARVQSAREQALAALGGLLRGSLVQLSLTEDAPEIPDEALRRSILAVDGYVDRLASMDGEVIAGMAALGTPAEGSREAAVARRARSRAAAVRYPAGALLTGTVARFVEPWDALPDTVGPDVRANVRKAIDAWSPGATAAIEALRTTGRSVCPAILLSVRAEAVEIRARPDGADADEEEPEGDEDAPEPEGMRVGLARTLDRSRMAVEASSMAGRDAVEAVLPPELRPAFRTTWNAMAAPESREDPRNALPVIDQVRSMTDLDGDQRRQIDALRADHAARHAAACNSIAELHVEMSAKSAIEGPEDEGPTPVAWIFGTGRRLSDARFERNELDSRSLRRLRSMLRPEQIARVPALTARPRNPQPRGAAPGQPDPAGAR